MMGLKPKPEGSRWTDEQWKAITARGNNILVAAAAGSGKTAVLVERIIQLITDRNQPVDVDQLLVVTFTNAAAQEMRQRIGQALEKALMKEPHSQHLRRQLALLNRAQISTLHAFCLSVVRQYYYLLDLDPRFRLANETEAELLKEEVLEELLEEEYGRPDNEQFLALVDSYTSDRGDGELAALINKVYTFSRSHPNPDIWLNQMAAMYEVKADQTLDELPWGRELLRSVRRDVEGCLSLLKQAIAWSKAPDGPAGYAEQLQEELEQIERLSHAPSWEAMRDAFLQVEIGRLKPLRTEVNPDLQEKVKKARETVKKQLKKLESLFQGSTQELLDDLARLAPHVQTLVRLVRTFGERYWLVKKARGLVDFNDLEHLALALLSGGSSQMNQTESLRGEPNFPESGGERGDDWFPSAIAQQFRHQFAEILVDEYQDTNMVQETILQLLSRGNNLFMVGDVKQSIYRFRLAEPNLFLAKYKTFTPDGKGPGLRIDLSKNFRSRPEVLEGTNFLFYQLMDEEVGEIDYDEQAALKAGSQYPEQKARPVELLVINKGEPVETDGEEEQAKEEELETAQLEARLIARQIKALIEEAYQVLDKESGEMRNITYRDMVILMRSMPWAPVMMEELGAAGIPVYAELSTGYFEAVEISTMLSILKVIDNPDQDIPLAAVLRSPLVGLTENELAQVRLQQKQGSYYTAFKTACQTLAETSLGQKLNRFYEQLQIWRARAREGALAELIWQIYRETGYYDYVGGLPGGKERQANLRALYDRARSFESTSFRGLYRFLRFIDRLEDRGDDLGAARALGEQEDVVRLMTIHKSKGLEFPVVFVAGLGQLFNSRHLSSSVLLHKELGFGLRFVDPEARLAYPTLSQLALKERLKREMLAEEMRILYVALTRAREKLYLIGSVRDGAKTLSRWQGALNHPEWCLPSHERMQATSYLDWVGPAVMRHQEGRTWYRLDGSELSMDLDQPEGPAEVVAHPSRWKTVLVERYQLEDGNGSGQSTDGVDWQAVAEGRHVASRSAWHDEIVHRLSWTYPFKAAESLRSKQAVTEVNRLWQDQEHAAFNLGGASGSLAPMDAGFPFSLTQRPRFMQQEETLSAAERGNVIHLVMQHVNLKEPVTPDSVHRLLENMMAKELLTSKEAEQVDVETIVSFFSSPVGQRLQQASFVLREVPFSFGLPAREVYRLKEGPSTPHFSTTSGDNLNQLPKASEDVVLIQGVVDCLFRDEQGLVLLDYKTDTISGRFSGGFEEARPYLLSRYRTQLRLYCRAVEEIWQEQVDEVYLYFFDGGHLLQVPTGKGGEAGAPVTHR